MRRYNGIAKGIAAILILCVLAAGVCCMGFASRGDDGKWFGNGNISTWHWNDKTDDKLGDPADSEQTEQLPAEDGEKETAHTRVKAMAATINNNIDNGAVSYSSSNVGNIVVAPVGFGSPSGYTFVYGVGSGTTTLVNMYCRGVTITADGIPYEIPLTSVGICYKDMGSDSDNYEPFYVLIKKDGNDYTSNHQVPNPVPSQYSMATMLLTVNATGEQYSFTEFTDCYSCVLPSYSDIAPFHIDCVARTPVSLPDDPVKEGYTFVGWFYDSDFTVPYQGEPIYDTTELFAKFEINKFTVTFNSDGGSSVESQKVNWNTAVTLTTPTREEYAFKGWFMSDGTQYTNQPIKENITLTAHWERNVFNVTFDTDGGTAVETQKANLNEPVSLPTTTKTGYVFKGWFLSDGTEYTTQPVTGDMTLAAHWEIQTFTVTFYVDGEKYDEITVEYGTALIHVMQAANLASYMAMTTEGVRISKQSSIITEDTQVVVRELTGWEKYGDFVAQNQWYTWLTVGVAGVLLVVSIVGIVEMVNKRK